MEFSENTIVNLLELFHVFVVIGKLDLFTNYREIGPCFNATLGLLVLKLLLHALSISSSSLHGLVASSFLHSINDVALNVLTHVLVGLVTNSAISNGTWWTGSS